jgi:hypothetical protein
MRRAAFSRPAQKGPSLPFIGPFYANRKDQDPSSLAARVRRVWNLSENVLHPSDPAFPTQSEWIVHDK